MEQINVARLNTLASFLKTLPMDVFDISSWYCGNMQSNMELLSRPDAIAAAHECGTSACAMGWAVTIPEFKEAGLKPYRDSYSGMSIPTFRGEQGQDYIGFQAAEHFFGISRRMAKHFFGPDAYTREPQPSDVAARIEVYLQQPERYAKAVCWMDGGFHDLEDVDEHELNEDEKACAKAVESMRAKLPLTAW